MLIWYIYSNGKNGWNIDHYTNDETANQAYAEAVHELWRDYTSEEFPGVDEAAEFINEATMELITLCRTDIELPPNHSAAPLDLVRSVIVAWPQLHPNNQNELNGGDLVEWMSGWAERALKVLDENPQPEPETCKKCGGVVGYDAWVDSNGQVCGGPYDSFQCMNCESESNTEVFGR